MNHQTSSVPQIAYQSPKVSTQPMTESPLVDSGFIVPVFSPEDDLIVCLNKAMAFLTVVASSRGDKGKVILVLVIRVLLLVMGETMQADKQWLLNATTVKVKDIWQDNALSLSDQGMQHGLLRREKEINSFDGDDLAFQCMIGFRKFTAYLDPFIPMNIITQKAYNTIMVEGLESTGNNLVAIVRDVYVFVGSFNYTTDFVVLENIGEFIQINEVEAVVGRPFRKTTKLEYDCAKGLISFNGIFDNYTFQMPRTIPRQSEDFGKRFTPQQELSAEQGFGFRISNLTIESSNKSPVKVDVPSELPKVSLVNASLKKLKFLLAQFDFMVKKRTTHDARTENSVNIDRKRTMMNSMSIISESVNMDRKRNESCDKCFNLEAELLKSQNAHNDLLKSYSQLEKYCISLELSIQLNQEIFQKHESCDNQNALEILEFFENNDLKAQLQDKDTTICKLKEIIKSMREKSMEENVNYDYCEIETKNVELENSVAKLLSKNERLCKEINHVKQVFKDQFDSIKRTRVRTIEHRKEIVNIAAQIPSANTIVPGMFKLDLEPLAPRLLQNREAHIDYLKYTQEQADILWGIVKQAKVKQPLDNDAKKVAVTPKNNVKIVRFAKPLTSSSNTKQVESSKTSDSNTPVLSPTGLKCSTSNFGSKPTSNKKNDWISQTSSRNINNKVEAQPRKVNKKNRVVEPIHDVDIKHSMLNVNFELICATCKKSMFDGVYDMCLLDFVENMNNRAKSAKKHKKTKYLETYRSCIH
ncbi:hypothetical protein Tco_0867616 [Tanacetum coccineum]